MARANNVAVLCTDMVGCTGLTASQSRISGEIAEEVRRAHLSLLRQAIVSSGGAEVMSLDHGLVVVFPSPPPALACAVAMQQAVAMEQGVDPGNCLGPHSIGLRVGVSAGPAQRRSDVYAGSPFVEAAGLCAMALGGQILAAEAVRRTPGSRSPHLFARVGRVQLKGLSAPTDIYEVGWEQLAGDATEGVPGSGVALPERLALSLPTRVVGRSLQLARLEQVYKRVALGEGREVVLVSGEAGQGKSTLAAEATRRAEGAAVLYGRGDADRGLPYLPFVEALGDYLADASDQVIGALSEAHRADLAPLVPIPDAGRRDGRDGATGSGSKRDDGAIEYERNRLFSAVAGLLELAGASQPVVLVIDDLHLADESSLRLLVHLVRHTDRSRLLILATYRAADLSVTHPVTEAIKVLRQEQRVTRMDLKGWGDDDLIAYFEARAGHDLRGVRLAHAVYRETRGNPFFVTEVARNLCETGIVFQSPSGRWEKSEHFDELSLPNSVQEVVGTRVSRLGAPARNLLSVAAVIGLEFDRDLLARIADTTAEAVDDQLARAVRASFVQRLPGNPSRYRFLHTLVRDTLYRELPTLQRARLHRKVGDALEELGNDERRQRAGEIAHHLFRAIVTPPQVDRAIEAALRAGWVALESLAPDDAAHWFAQAVELADPPTESRNVWRIDALVGLGTAELRA